MAMQRGNTRVSSEGADASQSTTCVRSAAGSRHEAEIRLAMAALGLGMLLGFMWSSRNASSAVAEWQIFLARFSSMVAFVVIALAYRTRPPLGNSLLLMGAGCLAGCLACDGLALLIEGDSELVALGAVGSACEGAGLAALEVLFLEAVLSFDLRRGIVVVGAAYLVAELTYFTLLVAPIDAIVTVIRAGEVATLGLLVALRRMTSAAAGTGEANAPGSGTGSHADIPAGTHPTFGDAPLPAVLGTIACLTLAWGLFAQMTGEGAFAFFDTTSEIIMVAVRALLLVACVMVGARASFAGMAAACVGVWALGILVVGLLWGTATPSTSALVVKAGLYALQVFSLVILVKDGRRSRGDFYFCAGLVLSALMFAHVSRLMVLAVYANEPVVGDDAVTIVAVAAFLVILALAVALGSRTGAEGMGTPPTAGNSGGCRPGSAADSAATVTARRNAEFAARFERFCTAHDLPERECEVLLETLHGYTVDGVAERLSLSRETVKTYLSRTYSRAGVGGRQELLAALDQAEAEGLG